MNIKCFNSFQILLIYKELLHILYMECDLDETQPIINTLQIYVDYRETKLLYELNLLLPSVTLSQNLELGDILIVSTGTYPFTLLFERKAGNDLESSIKDRRYSEQKKRILASYLPHKCTYIIEGLGTINDANDSKYILNSAIIHTLYRDNMHVIHTVNVKETANFIKSVYTRCKAHPEYFITPDIQPTSNSGTMDGSNTYLSNTYNNSACVKIKSKKSDNIDVRTCYILQLCQIPGISHIIATEISQIYPTYCSLVDALRGCDTTTEKIKLLKRINMIADKKATKIVEYIQV